MSVVNIKSEVVARRTIRVGFTKRGLVAAVVVDSENHDPRAASAVLTGVDSQGLGVFTPNDKDVFLAGPLVVPVTFISGLNAENCATAIPSRIDTVRAAVHDLVSVVEVRDVEVRFNPEPPADFSLMKKKVTAS